MLGFLVVKLVVAGVSAAGGGCDHGPGLGVGQSRCRIVARTCGDRRERLLHGCPSLKESREILRGEVQHAFREEEKTDADVFRHRVVLFNCSQQSDQPKSLKTTFDIQTFL